MIVNTLWGEEKVVETKKCRRCGETKDIENFSVNRKFASGGIARRAYCIDCGKKQISNDPVTSIAGGLLATFSSAGAYIFMTERQKCGHLSI